MKWKLAVITCVVGSLAACKSDREREKQLADVAKDWSYVVRASQVMPVYPLTEDVFPGDMFLVQTPIDEQQSTWKRKGYLPLDNHLARLVPLEYEAFYKNSFGLTNADNPPRGWLRPIGDAGSEHAGAGSAPAVGSQAWEAAPKAAFPTYSFDVKKGSGLSAALPIQGIPVGLSLLGASSAYGSVTLADARTYGVDIASLHPLVQKWAYEHRDFLQHFAPRGENVNYLRIVNRVYLVGRVAVAIDNAETQSAGVKAGVPPPVELLIPQRANASNDAPSNAAPAGDAHGTDAASSADATRAYTDSLKHLNETLNATYADAGSLAPGAAFKFTAASARSVSMTETFVRPLVIGYLGFDVAIGADGELGPPIPTFAVLESGLKPESGSGSELHLIANSRMVLAVEALRAQAAAQGAEAPRAAELLHAADALERFVPPVWPCNQYGADATGHDGQLSIAAGSPLRAATSGFDGVAWFRGSLIATVAMLERMERAGTFDLKPPAAAGLDARAHLEAELAASRFHLDRLEASLRPHAALLAKIDLYTSPFETK